MGKIAIERFIYEGLIDYYLRIPLRTAAVTAQINTHQQCQPQFFYAEYMPKKDYTMRDVLAKRLKLVIKFEDEKKRRLGASAKFIKDAQSGLYNKYY